MNGKTLALVIGATAAALVAAGVFIWLAVAGPDAGEGVTPTAAPTVSVRPDAEDVVPVSPVGQAADGGDFDPLAVPDGIESGIGHDIPDDQLTQPGENLGVGDLIITNLYQSDAHANPYVLLVVDEITEPLAAAERKRALSATGASDDGRTVQKVTLRIRQIAGSGDMTSWHLARSIVPLNMKLESMTVVGIAAEACGDAKTPLAGHDGATNDTVQSCFYVFGSVNTPASPISSLSIAVRMGGKTQHLYVQSSAGQDLGLEDAHAHDHDDQWWEVDPDTGVPLVDPDTGKVVPKPGHEDHDH